MDQRQILEERKTQNRERTQKHINQILELDFKNYFGKITPILSEENQVFIDANTPRVITHWDISFLLEQISKDGDRSRLESLLARCSLYSELMRDLILKNKNVTTTAKILQEIFNGWKYLGLDLVHYEGMKEVRNNDAILNLLRESISGIRSYQLEISKALYCRIKDLKWPWSKHLESRLIEIFRRDGKSLEARYGTIQPARKKNPSYNDQYLVYAFVNNSIRSPTRFLSRDHHIRDLARLVQNHDNIYPNGRYKLKISLDVVDEGLLTFSGKGYKVKALE